MTRSLPSSVTGREVIFGGGLHAAIYAATRVAMGCEPPVVFEQNLATGGVFAQLRNFRMNSVNGASVESVASPSPSRVVPMSASDDLNWIPNSPHQVREIAGAVEYPPSYAMCQAIQRTLRDYADIYTGAQDMTFDRYGSVYSGQGELLGTAQRVIFAGGVVPKKPYREGRAVISGFDFLRRPVEDLASLKMAIVGGGDTAAQVAEYAVGQGMDAPSTPPGQIHWYGGESMPTTKDGWMVTTHARWAGLGRHFPQSADRVRSVIRPYPVRGAVILLGNSAMVNGQVYDIAVVCTGVQPAPCPVSVPDAYRVNGMVVARSNTSQIPSGVQKVYAIGTAAALSASFGPYKSRFDAAREAIYNTGPRTAALAASLPNS
jgi:hypothetical protein